MNEDEQAKKRALIKLVLLSLLKEAEIKMESLVPGTNVLVHLPDGQIVQGEVSLVYETPEWIMVRVLCGERLLDVHIADVEQIEN